MNHILFAIALAWQSGASPGSLFDPGGRFSDATRDFRASQVGDLITIVVSEQTSAVATGGTNSSRKSAANSSVASLAGIVRPGLSGLLNVTGDQSLQSTGETTRGATLTTTIAGTVVAIAPSGALTVEARKEIAVNSERQTITLRGVVRPADLTVANTVQSNQLAGLSIQISGKGVVSDAVRRPNLLYRLLLGLLPF